MTKFLDLAKTKVNYSVNNCRRKHRTSASPGFAIPVSFDILPLNSKLNVDYTSVIKSFAAVTPVFGAYDVRINTFVQDLSAYSYELSRNGDVVTGTGPGSIDNYFDISTGLFSRLPIRTVFGFPFTSQTSNLSGTQVAYLSNPLAGQPGGIHNVMYKTLSVHPTSLDCYLGLPPQYLPNKHQYSVSVNNAMESYTYKTGIFELLYLDIIRNYYVNRQFGYAPFAGWINPAASSGEDVPAVKPGYNWVPLTQLDDFFQDVYLGQATSTPGSYDICSSPNYPYKGFKGKCDIYNDQGEVAFSSTNTYFNHASAPHGKLFLVPYAPDINNTWVSTRNYDNMTSLASVNTSGSQILYQTLISVSHQQKFLQKLFLSGGLISDWMYAEYGTYGKNSCPRLIHSHKSDYVFDDVISQAETSEASLGDRGGLGYGANFDDVPVIKSGGRYLAVMQILTITPRVDYYQGVDYRQNITDLGKFPLPDFDNVSMQPRFAEQVYAVGSPVSGGVTVNRPRRSDFITHQGDDFRVDFPVTAALNLGYQTAYSEWKTDVDVVTGELTDTMRNWVFLRDYGYLRTLVDENSDNLNTQQVYFGPYVFPEEYSYVFNIQRNTDGSVVDCFQVNYKNLKNKKVLPIGKSGLPKVV